MTLYMMVTTAGANSCFVSDDQVIAQDSVNLIGAGVETLVIEFDQAA